MNKKYIGITGLRGVTACAIAYIFHYLILFYSVPVQSHCLQEIFAALGYLLLSASDVFFVMSGFLMMRKYDGRSMGGFMEYMLPRIRKIYPLMIITVIWAYIEENAGLRLLGYYPLHADGGEVRYSVAALFLNMSGFQTGILADGDTYAVNGPTWFVSVIMICNIIFYIIMRLSDKRWIRISISGIMIATGYLLVLYPVNAPLLYSCVARGYAGFFTGVMMWHFASYIEKSAGRKGHNIVEAAAFSTLILAVVLVYIMLRDGQRVVTTALYAQLTVFWACMTYLVTYGRIMSAVFGAKPFVWLGERAMAIFLCNLPTDIGIALADHYFALDIDYSSTRVWIVHIIISMALVYIVDYVDKKLIQPALVDKSC